MLFLVNPFITSGQVLSAGAGTFTVLGQEALFNSSTLRTSEPGNFALAGQEASFRRNLIFEAAAGAIALDGQVVTMIYGKGLMAEVGAFTVTGNEAGMLRSLVLAAGTGTFEVTGDDAALVRRLALAAEPGLFSVSGGEASFRAGASFQADAGLFSLAGQDASIARGAVLNASTGAYTLTGQGVTLARALRLQASMGSFAITGQDAGFITQASATYLSSAPDPAGWGGATGGGTSKTWTGVTMGTQYTHLVVAISVFDGDPVTRTVTGVTIAGQTATQLAQRARNFTGVSLWIVAASAASGDIVATANGDVGNGYCYALWGVKGLLSTTPLSISEIDDGSSDNRFSGSLATTSDKGFAIFAASIWNLPNTSGADWTGGISGRDFATFGGTPPFPGMSGKSLATAGSSISFNTPDPGSSNATNTAVAVALR